MLEGNAREPRDCLLADSGTRCVKIFSFDFAMGPFLQTTWRGGKKKQKKTPKTNRRHLEVSSQGLMIAALPTRHNIVLRRGHDQGFGGHHCNSNTSLAFQL